MQNDNSPIRVRDMRNGDWYWISRLVYEEYTPKIKAIGLAIYNAYASYARDKGRAFPSQSRIAKTLGVTTTTVRKYNKILEKNGLIRISSGKKQGTSNIVYLLKVRGGEQIATPSKPAFHLGSNQLSTKEKKVERNKTKENFSFKEILESCKRGCRDYKPFFRDNPMVWKKTEEKWYVIEDGEWKEFAAPESEIEWR